MVRPRLAETKQLTAEGRLAGLAFDRPCHPTEIRGEERRGELWREGGGTMECEDAMMPACQVVTDNWLAHHYLHYPSPPPLSAPVQVLDLFLAPNQ